MHLYLIFVLFFASPFSFAQSRVEITCNNNNQLLNFKKDSANFEFPLVSSSEQNALIEKKCETLKACLNTLGPQNSLNGLVPILTTANAQSNDRLTEFSKIKRIENFINACNKKTTRKPTAIKIDYPFDGPNKAIRSANYDSDTLKKIIQMALLNGIDPYLALSISTIESPALISKNSVAGYEAGYGDLPIDGLPIFDKLGCIYKAPKSSQFLYVTPEQASSAERLYSEKKQLSSRLSSRDKQSIEKFRSFVVDKMNSGDGPHIRNILHQVATEKCPINGVDKEISQKVCSNPDLQRALIDDEALFSIDNKISNFIYQPDLNDLQRMELQSRFDSGAVAGIIHNKNISSFKLPWSGSNSKYLCAQPRSYEHGQPAGLHEMDKPDPNSCCVQVTGVTEGDNVEREFMNLMANQFIKNKINSSSGSVDEISLDIQKYNGTGIIGSTENVSNSCLSGIHMGTRPYYGARVADLMLNSMMSNSQIQQLVKETSAELGLNIESMLCKKVGSGKHSINSDIFLNQQKSFLLNGASQANVKTKLKNGSVAVPTSAEDKKLFTENENERKKACSKLFQK